MNKERRCLWVTEEELDAIASGKTYIFPHLPAWESLLSAPGYDEVCIECEKIGRVHDLEEEIRKLKYLNEELRSLLKEIYRR